MDHSNHRRHEHHLNLRKRVAIPNPEAQQGGTKTVVQVVYVTQDPIATDEATSFSTPAGDETLIDVATATPTPARKQTVHSVSSEQSPEQSQSTFKKSTKAISTTSDSDTSTRISSSGYARSSSYHSASAALDATTGIASPTSTSTPANNTGLSVGAYAGIIGGGVAVCLLLIGIVALVIRRKKNSNYTKPEDEKGLNRLSFNDRAPASPVPMPAPVTPAAAPKLQLRPMTQFESPAFLGAAGSNETVKSHDRPSVRGPPPALSLDKSKTLAAGPFQTPEPSPAMSAFSDNSNLSLPIQGAAGSGPSPVHRIMVDFKPSMADELELCSGELVRMLHEYDDGWALCIRMDRSQQGVCPRTCLSPRPVKPRPPPGAQAQRGPPPPSNGARGPGGPPRPQSPGGRSQSPGVGSRSQSPRGSGPNRPPMSPKGMPGPPRGPMGYDSRPSSPMGGRNPHPLSKVQRDDDIQFHAM